MERVRILIVEDHPVIRRGLAATIDNESDMVVCAQAADVTEALRQVEATHPHVIIVDLSLKTGHGIDLIEQISDHHAHIKTIVSSMEEEELFAERALRAGAMGYVNKQEPPEMLIEAIREVVQGNVYLSPQMANRMLRAVVEGKRPDQGPLESLSNRELQVFEMIGQGLSTKQIASKLHISHKTVETHREKIKEKLNLHGANELNHCAMQWALKRQR
jgi:DNA-binding NarL/FixJ family response regulator